MRHRRIDDVLAELRRAGIKPRRIVRGGSGHFKIYYLTRTGAERYIVASYSPSDWRSRLNEVHNARRRLRQDGFEI